MFVLLIVKTVGDCFNPSVFEIILHLKGLPFLDAHPEPWIRNITVEKLTDAKPALVTLCGEEKVSRIVEVLKNTTHNGFPIVDQGVFPSVGLPIGAMELKGLILKAPFVAMLRKKWFLT
ncbi:hypothetical protein GIB67_029446 [Kingdonia uniflora]|uniref:Uncharacterized protein n=1 Tax=Kingdonia uniflora TaxID=39325 RepID=A0A7J7NYN1_9MAGN|nr:hypothetical protein GIB67_029446 [Kingdonia uniflora]